MYEFTLLKSMFFELDKYKIEGVTQTKEKQRTFRRLEVSYDSVPEITSITAEFFHMWTDIIFLLMTNVWTQIFVTRR